MQSRFSFCSLALSLLCSLLFLGGCRGGESTDPQPTGTVALSVPEVESSSGESSSQPIETSGAAPVAGPEPVSVSEQEMSPPAQPQDISSDPKRGQELLTEADSLRAQSNYARAAEVYQDAMQADPSNSQIPYQCAVNYAEWGKDDLAIEALALAADMGYADTSAVTANGAFSPLRENPRFQRAMERIENNP